MVAYLALKQKLKRETNINRRFDRIIFDFIWGGRDKIKRDTGYTESEVIAIMRKNLKNKSFIIWRKRVYGRKTKHEKLTRLIDRELEQ